MIAIGSDHGGFILKEEIIKYLDSNGIEYKDFGAHNLDEMDDFPDYVENVCRAIINGECEKGILFCGTGIGVSIAANKFKGIRAALCHNEFTAKSSVEHNNANVLALGGRVLSVKTGLEIVDTWLNSKFIGGKYQRRNDKITNFECLTIDK